MQLSPLKTQSPSLSHKPSSHKRNSVIEDVGPSSSWSDYFFMDFLIEKDYVFDSFCANQKEQKELIYETLIWHHQLKLKDEILYCSLCYMRKYIQKERKIKNKKLLVLGCLYVSQKYSSKRIINLQKWNKKLSLQINKDQLFQTEFQILTSLNFRLEAYTRYHYLKNMLYLMNLTEKKVYFCEYLLQISLIVKVKSLTYSFTQCDIAFSILMVCSCFFKEMEEIQYGRFGRREEKMKVYRRELLEILKNVDRIEHLKAIKQKYKQTKFKSVAELCLVDGIHD